MSTAPFLARLQADNDAVAAAASASRPVRAPIAGSVSRVAYAPVALITGVATNNRTIQLVNRGQDGSGATVVATLTFGAGTNAAAFDETPLTLQAAANLVVAEGDVLEFRSSANGTGLADPGGLVTIEINR